MTTQRFHQFWYRILGLIGGAGVAAVLVVNGAMAQEAPTPALLDTPPVPTSTSPTYTITVEQLQGLSGPVGDYVVGPGKVELQVKPGQSGVQYITVSNRTAEERVFTLSVEDLSGSADGSQNVVLLGDQEGPYTLREYISFPVPEFTLGVNERARVPVVVSMPPRAEPGGYYGSVLVSTIQDAGAGNTQTPRSPINARVGTLFFITVPGDFVADGRLTQFAPVNDTWLYSRGPIPFVIGFQNQGSVHLNPYGEVRITNILGEEVGYLEIEPWFVLPESIRLRDFTWNREFLFGRYTFTAAINRGHDNLVDEQSFVVWVMPWQIVLGTFVVILLLHVLVRWIRKNFEFKRKA